MYCITYFIVIFAMVIRVLGAPGSRFMNGYNTQIWNYPHVAFMDNSDNQTDFGIVGGELAKSGEIPYQVALLYKNRHYCGGSILHNCWILTAAQCVVGLPIEELSILAGTTKLNSGGIRVRIDKIISHSDFYKFTLANDIALIKLKQSLAYSRNIQAINLLATNINPGTVGVVSGWGYINDEKQTTNDLKKLVVKSISNSQCSKFFVEDSITCGSLCTLNVGEGFCQGDSGGPLVEVQSKRQIGLVSGNRGCAKGFPDLYTRLSVYMQWIQNNLK